VAGVEEERKKEERKKKKEKKNRGGLGFTRISSVPPSAVDPRVVDLRVEPDHRSSACGRARDLLGDEISARAARRLFGASGREEAPLRPLDGGARERAERLK
jgi:hypothetical protein